MFIVDDSTKHSGANDLNSKTNGNETNPEMVPFRTINTGTIAISDRQEKFNLVGEIHFHY
jgi:hypothetical protein